MLPRHHIKSHQHGDEQPNVHAPAAITAGFSACDDVLHEAGCKLRWGGVSHEPENKPMVESALVHDLFHPSRGRGWLAWDHVCNYNQMDWGAIAMRVDGQIRTLRHFR